MGSMGNMGMSIRNLVTTDMYVVLRPGPSKAHLSRFVFKALLPSLHFPTDPGAILGIRPWTRPMTPFRGV